MRWDVINELLRGQGSYLEIGVSSGSCARRVVAEEKWGVDPEPHGNAPALFAKFFTGTSDNFFAKLSPQKKFDVVFIDGLHHAGQVYRDVVNAVAHLKPRGVILLHDCNPLSEAAQAVPRRVGHWNGDCWKAIALLRSHHPELNTFVLNADEGIGVVVPLKRPAAQPALVSEDDPFKLAYDDLVKNRRRLLGLISAKDRWRSLFLPRTTLEVVSATFGGVDVLRPARMQHCSALALSDQRIPAGWRTKEAKHYKTPRLRARRVKTLIHQYSSADITLWIDGSFAVLGDPADWALELLQDRDIALFRHPDRETVAAEARVCLQKRLASPSVLNSQVGRYAREGFTDNVGLFATGIVLRRMTPKICELGEAWWSEVLSSERDQLSLPYLIWKLRIPVKIIPGNIYEQRLFRHHRHR
jgi:hypothetical protein